MRRDEERKNTTLFLRVVAFVILFHFWLVFFFWPAMRYVSYLFQSDMLPGTLIFKRSTLPCALIQAIYSDGLMIGLLIWLIDWWNDWFLSTPRPHLDLQQEVLIIVLSSPQNDAIRAYFPKDPNYSQIVLGAQRMIHWLVVGMYVLSLLAANLWSPHHMSCFFVFSFSFFFVYPPTDG